jgi:hypothetical protein
MMSSTERLQAALKAPDSVRALRNVVFELTAEGCTKREIAALLEKLLLDMREQPDHHDSDEDAVSEVLDGLGGWCQAEARLLPGQKVQ